MNLLVSKLKDTWLINEVHQKYGSPLQIAIRSASIDKSGVPSEGQEWIDDFHYFNEWINKNFSNQYSHIVSNSAIGKIWLKNYEK